MTSLLDRVLITGGTGQVGRALQGVLPQEVFAPSRAVLNLSTISDQLHVLDSFRPTCVINSGAFTAVDAAEDLSSQNIAINEHAVGVLARWCAKNSVPLLHISTDYVFNGLGDEPWTETSPIDPQNAYGLAKSRGEKEMLCSGCVGWIIRTSWVYDHLGKNFFTTMLRLFAIKNQISVVSDQVGSPTYAPDLAGALVSLLSQASGALKPRDIQIYHVTGTGATTWFEFARQIYRGWVDRMVPSKHLEILPILSQDYPTPARRPLNSRMDMGKLIRDFNIVMPEWQDGLRRCFEEQGKVDKWEATQV